MSQNDQHYPLEAVNQFTYETVEILMMPLFHNSQFLEKDYLVELIIRYKDVILLFLKLQEIQSVQLAASPVPSSACAPVEPNKKGPQLKQLTMLDVLPTKRKK